MPPIEPGQEVCPQCGQIKIAGRFLCEHDLYSEPTLKSTPSPDSLRRLEETRWVDCKQELPAIAVWVMAWLHLPKNPTASGHVLAQYSGCTEDEPEDYGLMRRTAGCWWANGRYYERGHVTHWQPLDAPPTDSTARRKEP